LVVNFQLFADTERPAIARCPIRRKINPPNSHALPLYHPRLALADRGCGAGRGVVV
jgi:hypothetical protein